MYKRTCLHFTTYFLDMEFHLKNLQYANLCNGAIALQYNDLMLAQTTNKCKTYVHFDSISIKYFNQILSHYQVY